LSEFVLGGPARGSLPLEGFEDNFQDTTPDSPTNTVKEPEALFPEASLAVQVTVVTALAGNTVPEGGVQFTVGGVPMLSVALTV
jgi:hypothetical protein